MVSFVKSITVVITYFCVARCSPENISNTDTQGRLHGSHDPHFIGPKQFLCMQCLSYVKAEILIGSSRSASSFRAKHFSMWHSLACACKHVTALRFKQARISLTIPRHPRFNPSTCFQLWTSPFFFHWGGN